MSILLVLAATFIGSLAGFLVIDRFRRSRQGGPARREIKAVVVAGAVLLAAIAAVATNATQRLLDLGLAFTTVDVLEAVSYFVFGSAITAAWVLLKPSRLRWLLAALVPVALFEPLRWALALAAWSIRRLGLW
jgi:hypothetical protein